MARQTFELVVALLVFSGGILLGAAPQTTPYTLAILACLVLVATRGLGHDARAALAHDSLFLILAGFCGYCLASAFWAFDASAAAKKSLTVAALLLATFLLAAGIKFLRARGVARYAVAALASVTAISAIHVIDIESGMGLTKAAYLKFPWVVDPKLKGIATLDGTIRAVLPFLHNQGVAALVFMFWPCMLLSRCHDSRTIRVVSVTCLVAAVLAMVIVSVGAAAQVAFALGIAAFALSHLWPGAARGLILAAWCSAVLLVVPASYLAWEAGLHEAAWVPKRSAQARIYIWRYTAEHIFERPLLGIGVRSTRRFESTRRPVEGRTESERYTKRAGWHAHNIYLQTWFELGAIGAAFLLAIGVAVLARIGKLRAVVRPYGYATFVTIATAAAFGWGMWQTWLWATTGLAVGALALGSRFLETGRGEQA